MPGQWVEFQGSTATVLKAPLQLDHHTDAQLSTGLCGTTLCFLGNGGRSLWLFLKEGILSWPLGLSSQLRINSLTKWHAWVGCMVCELLWNRFYPFHSKILGTGVFPFLIKSFVSSSPMSSFEKYCWKYLNCPIPDDTQLQLEESFQLRGCVRLWS